MGSNGFVHWKHVEGTWFSSLHEKMNLVVLTSISDASLATNWFCDPVRHGQKCAVTGEPGVPLKDGDLDRWIVVVPPCGHRVPCDLYRVGNDKYPKVRIAAGGLVERVLRFGLCSENHAGQRLTAVEWACNLNY